MIKAIGYDVDGTLVDSEPLHVLAWHEALRQQRRKFEDLPLVFQHTMAGRKPIEIATFMVQSLNIDMWPQAFLGVKHTLFMESVRTSLQAMPGAVESIKRFANDHVLGIGTSLDRAYIDLVLERLGIAHYFRVIVTGDVIKHGKPDPETYLVLAKKLGVRPLEMVVFEDANSGIKSAKAAGCYCVAVYNAQAVQQDTSQADRTVASLNEVDDALLNSLSS